MKFKKVEISAFRIYDNPGDATFDFSTENGEVANFVSLYAPNGFGKTSFYDAVEWGITNNIYRFWQNEKNTESSLAAQQSISPDSKLRLWRNTKSKNKTYVKITTENKEEIFRELVLHGNTKKDITNANDVLNKEFRQVILSQEWISGFLKEFNGEVRYKKFMDNPLLKEVDNYFIGLKSMLGVCYAKIDALNHSVGEEKKNIKKNEDNNLLETINKQIELINNKYDAEGISQITLSTTKEQIKQLQDLLTGRTISGSREKSFEDLLNYILIAKTGNDKICNINVFLSSVDLEERATKDLAVVKDDLQKFEQLEKLNIQIESNQKNKTKTADILQLLNNIIGSYNQYSEIKTLIDKKNESKTASAELQKTLNSQIQTAERGELILKGQLETYSKVIGESEDKIKKLPDLKKNIEELDKSINELDLRLKNENTEIEKKEKTAVKHRNEIRDVKFIFDEISKENPNLSVNGIDQRFDELIRDIRGKRIQSAELKGKLESVSTKISQQEALNIAIEDFIKRGLSIVNDKQASSCPLCEHEYDSYNQLVERITGNKALSVILQELLVQKNSLDQDIFKLSEECNQGVKSITDFYRNIIDSLNKTADGQAVLLKEAKGKYSSLETELKDLKEKRQEHSLQLGGLTIEEFTKQLTEILQEAIRNRDLFNQELITLQRQHAGFTESLKNQTGILALLEKEIGELKKNDNYILILQWFKDNYSGESIDVKRLEVHKDKLSAEIDRLTTQLEELGKSINLLATGLNSVTKETLIDKQKELDLKLLDAVKYTSPYTHFLKDRLDVDVKGLKEQALLGILGKKELEAKTQLKKLNELKEEYIKLEKYSQSIYPFLQSENAIAQLKIKEDELAFLIGEIKPAIEREREKTKNFLDQRVKDFFYEDLINDLYRKIDPHPDFKSVEFKAVFDAENPTLDVFVKNNKDEEALIPNLYFSTAQLNILSLSIFLASALNSKEFQCIFIDDPIQSMDSINTLSTIDLLRSIVINTNKQIILSTHDENFHNLLRKKIPATVFRSTFLELETFGKVKSSQPSPILSDTTLILPVEEDKKKLSEE